MKRRKLSKPDQLVLLGAITGVRGLKGEVVLKSFTDPPEAIASYGVLVSEDGTVEVEIESLAPRKAEFTARLKGVADRTAAERLKGTGLHVPRSLLGEAADEDEFFHTDLIGLEVVRDGEVIGKVVALPDFGAGDLLELRLTGQNSTVLLPFTKDAVPEVDLENGRIVVDPPEGLWDRGGVPDDGMEERRGR